jgi:2-methylcitrate dehydratase PrpD
MMEKTLAEQWADFALRITFGDLPPQVVHQTKIFILDNIGCALGGYALDWGKKVVAVGRDLGGRPEATVVGSGDKLHCANAAYVNAKLANVLDMDEVLYSSSHIGATPVFPALNVGERVKVAGRDVILAVALGYDFGARCALCGPNFLSDPEKGALLSDNGTFAYDTLAATVAAAKIFKLDKDQIINALTCAAYFSPGPTPSTRFSVAPSANFEKYADMGWFCLNGIIAALCAKNGYVGDPSILDGPFGLRKLLGALKFDTETFEGDLGKRWYIMDAGIKPYPTCRFFHTGIKLLEGIMKEHNLKPGDIDKIVVNAHLGATWPTYVTADKWAESIDKELWTSQFSFTYALACTVYGITPGPEWAREEVLTDPKIVEMTKKITHGVHPGAVRKAATWKGHSGKLLSELPTSVEVVARQGRFAAESNDIPGDTWNPRAKLSDGEIVIKFRNNACQVLTEARINSVIETVSKLDKIEDIGELTKLVAP